ncbi:ABC transporter permease [Streptomyces acidiscabies]|uniref:ABC transporter permease n=1 Tax=Streptomyces acidiscabies TaxID=42234 RepID=UPI0038F80B3D
MSTTTQPLRVDVPARRTWARRLAPSGMVWLVWRQHRTAFLLLLAAAALMTAGLAWLAHDVRAAITAAGATETPTEDLATAYGRFGAAGLALTGLPVVIGVFVGAPLFAGDLETGTAKFVGAQSRSRRDWVITKLGTAAVFAGAAALSTGIAMKALLTPLVNHIAFDPDFTDAAMFDTTGPVTVALALLGLLIGAAAGLLTRRTLPAMVVTFFVLLALKAAWSYLRTAFETTVTATTGGGRFAVDDFPDIPGNALQTNIAYITGDGSLRGWNTCVAANDRAACLRGEGVVGWSREYLPFSHFTSMQWTATGALAVLILLAGGVVVYGARRALR